MGSIFRGAVGKWKGVQLQTEDKEAACTFCRKYGAAGDDSVNAGLQVGKIKGNACKRFRWELVQI